MVIPSTTGPIRKSSPTIYHQSSFTLGPFLPIAGRDEPGSPGVNWIEWWPDFDWVAVGLVPDDVYRAVSRSDRRQGSVEQSVDLRRDATIQSRILSQSVNLQTYTIGSLLGNMSTLTPAMHQNECKKCAENEIKSTTSVKEKQPTSSIPEHLDPHGPRLTFWTYKPQWPREGSKQRMLGPVPSSRQVSTIKPDHQQSQEQVLHVTLDRNRTGQRGISFST